ncbi:non-structural protein 2 [Rotavirus B]|uniref:Non-structural protein 2 n=2 Tax=Rotavirus B TaxID=28876 RepID=D6NFS0_ROTGA|nr:nonstructural protein NSP2 [Human rotavirus B]AKA40843.1 non-structural protein 2 [Rotavirus B]AFP25393.1 nonstructural protein NSP2 [Human rotavirus B]AFP25396.1 nonstructural protein NSP2 [Human rotavirus B]AFP25397.1 nonstructural protein NSP2 [Human rotavirus B]
MTHSVSLSDFIVKTEDGYMPSDRECVALDRYLSKEQKELRETFKDGKNDRSALRIKMFLSPSPSRRFTQHGVVPMREIKTNTDIPSTLWTLVTDWLLNLLQDEENQEMFEDFISSKFPDVLASADKLARFAQRLEDRKDVLHKNFSKAMNAFGACFWAIKPTFATEGKCNVVRATDDSMILEFQPVPEYFRCGRSKATFYKLYPLTDEQPVNGMLALKAVAGNQFFMYHGHGHIRTVPYHELADAIKSFARKDKETLESISKSPLAAQCGSKFLDMLDGIRSKQKIEDVILKAKIFEKKRS